VVFFPDRQSQPAFAKTIGCSSITVQRIENRSLKLSRKLANKIMDATGADPASLISGKQAGALNVLGGQYDKDSIKFYRSVLPCDEKESNYLMQKAFQSFQLLFIAAHRGGKYKTHAVNSALQNALLNLADDFDLTKSIHQFLVEQGMTDNRTYRVRDLRKFPEYARIIGYKDNKRFKADKLIKFVLPRGWIDNYYLHVTPILPHGADRKLRDADYILDNERPIPQEIKEAVAQAIYWEIKEFRADFTQEPIR
jgi:hypothetical protein